MLDGIIKVSKAIILGTIALAIIFTLWIMVRRAAMTPEEKKQEWLRREIEKSQRTPWD